MMQQAHKAVLLLLGLSVVLGTCAGHGYIHKSRSRLCTANDGNLNKNCGLVQYEPQSVEGPKGFPSAGPPDGKIASGNLVQFKEMDEFGTDRWFVLPISQFAKTNNSNVLTLEFHWILTMPHQTTSFDYYISKKNYNPNAPLTRAQLELQPFCSDVTYKGKVPPSEYTTRNCVLNADGYGGQHVILGVWTIDDTVNAFYQAIDVKFTGENIPSSAVVHADRIVAMISFILLLALMLN